MRITQGTQNHTLCCTAVTRLGATHAHVDRHEAERLCGTGAQSPCSHHSTHWHLWENSYKTAKYPQHKCWHSSPPPSTLSWKKREKNKRIWSVLSRTTDACASAKGFFIWQGWILVRKMLQLLFLPSKAVQLAIISPKHFKLRRLIRLRRLI